MRLSDRINLLVELGAYIQQNNDEWQAIKKKASTYNPWFLPEFIDLSINNIAQNFLQKEKLAAWVAAYKNIPDVPDAPKLVGIVMAGNIPLVGFYDFLCVFISGNKCVIKPSSKDEILIKHLANKLIEWAPELKNHIAFSELLKNCDAYIATGSNSTAGYFNYYFGKYPHIIRRNRTSVAILTGHESTEDLNLLADDVYQYFGMGCRNITKIYVPENYDFLPLLGAFKKYNYLADHHKYKNNYDYNLSIHILNNKKYMSNASIILIDEKSLFSPVSQLNYEIYSNEEELVAELAKNDDVQCIIGSGHIPFGKAQRPSLNDYADGIDTMKWLEQLNSQSA